MTGRYFLFLRALLMPLASIVAPCKIMDKEKLKKYDYGRLLISNHLSWMDIVYQIFWVPSFKRFLSKKENGKNKLLTRFLLDVGVIFVNRDKPELSSMRECIDALKAGQTLSLYPEGTRNRVNRQLQPLHGGGALFALKGKAFVVPIAVHHKGKLFRRNYMGIGDPIELGDLYERRLDEAVLVEATERFRVGIQNTMDKLDAWVECKGWKADKKRRRAERKALRKQYKTAKREYDKSTRCE